MGQSVKHYLVFFLLFFSVVSCQKNKAQQLADKDTLQIPVKDAFTDHLIDTAALGINFIPSGNYNFIKQNIVSKREAFKSLYINAQTDEEKQIILDSARQFFSSELVNRIIPHWYGTGWDFNGYTNIPNQGVVACGYFISTTLKHMGVKINRYKYAQQAGLNGAKTISPDNDFKVFYVNTFEELDSLITKIENEYPSGLYTVGLSNHVGYVYISDTTAYFIHSNYIDGYVMTEKARYSDAFQSMIVVLTDVTYNDYLIKSWILNNEITVVTD